MNIITSQEVTGKVTTRMVNVPWDQALDTILKTFGWEKIRRVRLSAWHLLELLRKERDDELQSKRVVEELEAPVTRTIQLSYARAEELKSNMEKLLTKQGRLDVDKRTNTIIVKDISSTVDEVLELIRRLDSQTRQVSIETRIVETARTFLEELGIRWGGFVNQETGVKFPRQVALLGRQPALYGPHSDESAGSAGYLRQFCRRFTDLHTTSGVGDWPGADFQLVDHRHGAAGPRTDWAWPHCLCSQSGDAG